MNRLEQLREAAALSRADLSRRSDVSQTVIEKLEAGAHLEEGERAVEVPGETPVEDIAVILTKLADALNANLFNKGIAVTSEELLGPARDDLTSTQAAVASDETLPALPLVGVSHKPSAEDLPPEARSHNETETPDDIDAALKHLALDAEITASETAAVTGADEVTPEPGWPEGPVSPAASTSGDSAPTEEGLAPTGGTETINMAELPDTLPIGVLPGTLANVETKEVSPITEQPVTSPAVPDREFASQETQEIYIPPEVLATLPTNPTSTGAEAAAENAKTDPNAIQPAFDTQETQPFDLSQINRTVPAETEAVKADTEPVVQSAAPVSNDAPTVSFDTGAVRAQAVKDTTELETEEMAPLLEEPAPETEITLPPGDYEEVPGPDMPGPAPAPETMETASEAHPEPPDLAVVESEEAVTAPEIAPPSTTAGDSEANLGLPTSHEVEEVVPNSVAPLVPPVAPTPLEVEAATPAQDVTPLTKSQPEQPPAMQPYVAPGPTDAEANRYKLPPSTVIPSVVGVVGVIGWFLWRSWRRSRAEAKRVAPYTRKK